MQTEYIRRQDALDAFGLSEKTRKYGGDHSGYDTRMLYEIQDALTGLPSADVAPIVHAHWIRHENADIICGYYVPSFECSQCGTWKEDDSDFCPDCGAKMYKE